MGEEQLEKKRRESYYANPIPGLTLMGENGLTKREWMAGMIAAGLVCEGERFRNEKKIAEAAVRIADAVINECRNDKTPD